MSCNLIFLSPLNPLALDSVALFLSLSVPPLPLDLVFEVYFDGALQPVFISIASPRTIPGLREAKLGVRIQGKELGGAGEQKVPGLCSSTVSTLVYGEQAGRQTCVIGR